MKVVAKTRWKEEWGQNRYLRELCREKKLKNIVRVDNVKTLCVDSDKETSAVVSTRWHVVFCSFSYRRLIVIRKTTLRCSDQWRMVSWSGMYGVQTVDRWFLGQVCAGI